MAAAANFAWANRQAIAHEVRQAVRRVLGREVAEGTRQVYDVPRQHGHGELRPRGAAGLARALVRHELPRSREAPEPHAAKRQVTGAQLRRELEARGVVVRCPSNAGLAEEAPLAYEDVGRVVEVVERAGLAKRVARLEPLGVVKG